MTVQRDFGWSNVLDQDAMLRAGGDIGIAINRILAGLPDIKDADGSGFSSYGSHRIVVPTGGPNGPNYSAQTQIEVPSNKMVEIVGDSPWGIGIENDTGTDYTFVFDDDSTGVGHHFSIRNLALVGGGLDLTSRRRGLTEVEGVKFVDTPAPAILFADDPAGLGPVTTRVHNGTQFIGCAGGVWHAASTYLIGFVDHVRFIAMRDTPLVLDGIGLDVSDLDFQGATADAYIHLPGITDLNSLQTIRRCRFGSETVNNYKGHTIGTPGCDILIGSSDLSDPPRNISSVAMHGNRHMGSLDGSKDYAIRLADRPRQLTIDQDAFFASDYNVAHVSEEWTTALSPQTATSGERLIRNHVGNIAIQDPGDATPATGNAPPVKSLPFFEKGGIGWDAPSLHNAYTDGEGRTFTRRQAPNGTIWAESIDNAGVSQSVQVS